MVHTQRRRSVHEQRDGHGGGAIPAVAYAAVARGYVPQRRPRVLSLFSAAWIVPGLTEPAVSGALADHVSWRVVFLGLVPVALAAAMLTVPAMRRLPRNSDLGPPPQSWKEAAMLALGAAMLLGASWQNRSPPWYCSP